MDTGEDLGAPLTSIVDTYVGVAGPNHGVAQQVCTMYCFQGVNEVLCSAE